MRRTLVSNSSEQPLSCPREMTVREPICNSSSYSKPSMMERSPNLAGNDQTSSSSHFCENSLHCSGVGWQITFRYEYFSCPFFQKMEFRPDGGHPLSPYRSQVGSQSGG